MEKNNKRSGLCPVIKLTECHYPDGSLVNHYSGAGVALIACKDNTILDLEYLTEDPFSKLKLSNETLERQKTEFTWYV